MVPSRLIAVDRLPLTPSGKVDRLALANAPLEPLCGNHAIAARATRLEEMLVRHWCEILGLTAVGVTDNFFDLGGHSLLVTRVMSKIRSALGIQIPARTLFEVPTIRALAVQVCESIAARIAAAGGEALLQQLEMRDSIACGRPPDGKRLSSRAIACKAPRHRWHLRRRRHCGICNLQNLKDRGRSEPHPLRQT